MSSGQQGSGNSRHASQPAVPHPLPTRVLIETMAEEEERLLTSDLIVILARVLRPGASKAIDIELPSVEP
jgi:hypothetical protein